MGFLVGKVKVGVGEEGIGEGVSVGMGPTLKQPAIIIVKIKRRPSAVTRLREYRELTQSCKVDEH